MSWPLHPSTQKSVLNDHYHYLCSAKHKWQAGENSPEWLLSQMLFTLRASVDLTSISPHESRGWGAAAPLYCHHSWQQGRHKLLLQRVISDVFAYISHAEWFPFMWEAYQHCREHANPEPHWCHSGPLMHCLWLQVSSEMFSPALTGFRPARMITG